MAAVPIRLGKIVTRFSTSACYAFPHKSLKDPLKVELTRQKPGHLWPGVSLPLTVLCDSVSGVVQPVDVVCTVLDFDAREELEFIGSGLA